MDSISQTLKVEEDMTFGKKIMIADDDRTAHIMYGKTLANLGFEVLHAYDGEEAYLMAKQVCPDVLLLDIGMPKMDGRDICKKLKSDAATKNIKIIMVTGRDSEFDRLVGFEAGADEYVEKPCYPSYVERKIRSLLAKS
nr:response regulator [Desulfobulbaceae bacterium]